MKMKLLILFNFMNHDETDILNEIIYDELYTLDPFLKVIEHGCLIGPWDYYCIMETIDDEFIDKIMKFWDNCEVLCIVIKSAHTRVCNIIK